MNRGLLKSNPRSLVANVCEAHNVGRLADEKQARAILLQRKIDKYGLAEVEETLARLVWKVPNPELTVEAILSHAKD